MKIIFRKGWWLLALLVTFVGIGSSAYLTSQHYSILKDGFSGDTLCDISSFVNCGSVLMSQYGEIGTLPVAGLGLLFYIYILGALLYARIEPDSAPRILALPLILSIFSVLLSIGLAYVSLSIIKALCIFCTSLYLVNILLFFFLKKVCGMKFSEWFKQLAMKSWLKSLAYLSIIFLVGGILLHTTHKQYAKEISQEKLDIYLKAFFKQPAQVIDTEGRPYFGNKNANIVVAEFSDFECPYCKKAANTLKPILAQYQDQVKFVFMNYPLDSTCNESMQRAMHQQACNVSFASYCAGQQGKFWEYHDKAFARQPKFQKASLENIAKKLNLDLNKFNACLADENTRKAIEADIKQGASAGVRGTPTVFVNGRIFRPWPSRKAWKQLIEQLNNQPQD